jgi:hypothetical protein
VLSLSLFVCVWVRGFLLWEVYFVVLVFLIFVTTDLYQTWGNSVGVLLIEVIDAFCVYYHFKFTSVAKSKQLFRLFFVELKQ